MNQDTGQTFGLFGSLFAFFVIISAILVASVAQEGTILNLLGGMLLFFLVAGIVFVAIMIGFAVLAWLVARLVSTALAPKETNPAA